MNQQEFEKLMIAMVQNIYAVAHLVNPEINHVSMYSFFDGSVNFRAYHDDDENKENVRTILDISLFKDGDMKLSDGYYYNNSEIDFIPFKKEETA